MQAHPAFPLKEKEAAPMDGLYLENSMREAKTLIGTYSPALKRAPFRISLLGWSRGELNPCPLR